MYSCTRKPLKHLHDMHVWGSPTYILDRSIADGKKIPRWHPCSNRCIYIEIIHEHSTNVRLVLDTSSGSITPKFHIVFDDWFSTVTSSADTLSDLILMNG